jgi:hypothetical protein
MNRKIWQQLTIVSLLLVLTAGQSSPQSPKIESSINAINAKEKRLINYGKDFRQFMNLFKGTPEFKICLNLSKINLTTQDHLGATATLLCIYSLISTEKDRLVIKDFIRIDIDYYITRIGPAIEEINEELSDTKVPAIASTGTRLKEDLWEIKKLLESIRPQ